MEVYTAEDLVRAVFELEQLRADPGIYIQYKHMFFVKSYASWLAGEGKGLKNEWKITRFRKYLEDCVIPTLSPAPPNINKYSVSYGKIGSCFTVAAMTDSREIFDNYLSAIKGMLGEEIKIKIDGDVEGIAAVCLLVENDTVKFFKYKGV